MADDMNEKDGFLASKEDDSEEPVGNPAPPSDVDLDLLRGDRIGDTVYSGKWCIQTVMKMLQSNITMKPEEGGDQQQQPQTEDSKAEMVDMEEELQNEVGVLWDMTSNVEVCQYLQSVGAIESIYHVIANSRCPRATEMCVGMLGNIIIHDELWQSLQSDTTLFAILIPLFSSTDQPVLLELSRFFTTAMSHSEIGDCYATMVSNGALVTQELVRILSGSTNCDLLRHTTELTHILMCVDKDDSNFNALFADADFIAAVLEASKEIGYQQETSSQSSIMEILHGFTTYPAGITAMEPCMEAITEAVGKYLRSLCHNINLSNSVDIISVVITLINHFFCRSLEVRIQLMSSSKLLQNVLKILIALYRRLGLYDSIANPPHDKHHHHHHHSHQRHQHRHHHHRHHQKQASVEDSDDVKASSSSTSATASESWESVTEDDEGKSSRRRGGRGKEERASNAEESRSWSERATDQGGETPTKHIFATPDPSPKHHAHGVMKDIELLSWSERRMASPLVDGVGTTTSSVEDIWKIPQDTRKMKKKTLSMEKVVKADDDCDVTTTTTTSTIVDGKEEVVGQEEDRIVGNNSHDDDSGEVERVMGHGKREEEEVDSVVTAGSSLQTVIVDNDGEGETLLKNENENMPDSTSEMKDVAAVAAARLRTDSRQSGGFSPSMDEDEEEKDESMECDNLPGGGRMMKECVDDGDGVHLKVGGAEEMGRRNENVVTTANNSEISESERRNNGIGNNGNNDNAGDERLGNDEMNGREPKTEDADFEEEEDDVGGVGGGRGAGKSLGDRRPSHRSNLDKYQSLLQVVREFLSDFFNNFREGLLTEQGVPVISEIMSFLDSQCRRSTLRIVVHSLDYLDHRSGGHQDDEAASSSSSPVGRLLHLSSHMKARNVHAVLEECVGKMERQRL